MSATPWKKCVSGSIEKGVPLNPLVKSLLVAAPWKSASLVKACLLKNPGECKSALLEVYGEQTRVITMTNCKKWYGTAIFQGELHITLQIGFKMSF